MSASLSSLNISHLSGAEKVAVLLLALGKSKATGLLRRFDPEEIKLLTRSSTSLRPMGAADIEHLVEEFARKFSSGVKFMGTEREMRDLLSDVLSEDEYNTALYGEVEPMVAPLMQAAAAGNLRDDQIWDKISKVKVEELRAYLIKEHPQTVGVILSKLESEMAAKVVSSLPSEMRAGVLVRMLAARDVDQDAMNILEDTLAEDLLAATGPTKHGGVADILNRLDKSQSEDVMKSLAEVRPDDVKILKNMLFTFDDMITLTAPARTLVLDQVPIEKLVMALRGTDSAFQTAILASLAARSRRMVEAELSGGAAGPVREVQDARRFVVDTVLRMNSRGDIQIRQPENLSDVAQ